MAESKTPKASKTATRDWIIRGVVFGGLAVLLVLALLDFQAKQAALTTSDAWRAAVRAKGEGVELLKSEFGKIPVQGGPSSSPDRSEPTRMAHERSKLTPGRESFAATPSEYLWVREVIRPLSPSKGLAKIRTTSDFCVMRVRRHVPLPTA